MNPNERIVAAFEKYLREKTNMKIITANGFYYGLTLMRYQMFEAGWKANEAERGE